MATQPHPFKKEVMDEKLREQVLSDFLKGAITDDEAKENGLFTLECLYESGKRFRNECVSNKLNS